MTHVIQGIELCFDWEQICQQERISGIWPFYCVCSVQSKQCKQKTIFGVCVLYIFNPKGLDFIFVFHWELTYSQLKLELAVSRLQMCCPHLSRVISQECTGLPSHTIPTLDMHYEWDSSPFTVTHTNALLTQQRGIWAFIISINKSASIWKQYVSFTGKWRHLTYSKEIGQNMSSTCH